ncbi:MAG: hypothetical protein Q4Q23_07550, partial [Methanobacteriaceae archaeon]|nr:hypothetical protein [Methanobacteriaceae archaeon]
MSYINRKLMLFFILLIFSSITLVSATNNLDSDNGCIDDINLKSMDDNLKNTGNVLEDNIKMESKTIEDTNSNNYYYFNASVSSDNGNGTQSNPWKTINNNRINSIANNSHVYITNGQYN